MEENSDKEIKPIIYLGGFHNDIVVCGLFVERRWVPKWFPDSIRLKKIHWKVTTDKISVVNKWSDSDYEKFIRETINSYNNSKTAFEGKLKSVNKKLSSKRYKL